LVLLYVATVFLEQSPRPEKVAVIGF
jgi:hypothetical protein